MDKQAVQSQVIDTIKKEMGDPVFLVAYLEHQVDVLTNVVLHLAQAADPAVVEAIQPQLDALQTIDASSSIDFDNLTSPTEAFKLPMMVHNKQMLRSIQGRYLQRLMETGNL